jgi:hypothetical protein
MARSNTGKNAIVTGYINTVAAISVHSADPGTTGINELSGGSPAYARVARPSYTAPTTGLVSFQVDFNIGAGGQPAYAGMWDGSGNFLEGVLIPGAIPAYGSQGTFHLTVNAQGQ